MCLYRIKAENQLGIKAPFNNSLFSEQSQTVTNTKLTWLSVYKLWQIFRIGTVRYAEGL